ncbi:YciI family protein [Pantoea sp. SGAir0215]
MLYIVTLSYRGAAAEREKHSAGHKSWLVEHIKTGEVVLAGPLENQQGGVVLFPASDEQAVRDRLTEDPFVALGLVDVAVTGVHPALVSSVFDADWGSETKVVDMAHRA